MLLINLLYLLFASTFIFAKNVLTYGSPLLIISIRMLLAGSMLLAYSYLTHGKQLIQDLKNAYLLLALVGLFHIYGAYVLEFWSLEYISAAQTALIFNLSPFITALLESVFYNHRLSLIQIIALIIGFAAMLPTINTGTSNQWFLYNSTAHIALVGAVLCSCIGWLLIKKIVKDHHVHLTTINGFSMIIGGVLSCITGNIISLFNPTWKIFSSTNWPALIGYILILVMVSNIICYNLYGHLLKKYSATLLAMAGFTCPMFTALLQWIFQGSIPTATFWASAFISGCAIYIFYWNEVKKN